MKLVIVESPAKAKTINKYLGSDYEVLASYGHVRDLPAKDGSVKPDDDFDMVWEVGERGKKQMAEIVRAAKQADTLILATDPDREGEAISWHVLQILKDRKALQDKQVQRVVFNEITKTAITDAIAHPREIDTALVEAYLARRALDYLVGFTLSPVLWRKLPGSRSAGRVQSVALRLICDRELEIESFVAREYWTVEADFGTGGSQPLTARLTRLDGQKVEKFTLGSAAAAEAAKARILTRDYAVAQVESKPTQRHPQPPFTTSTLQQEAARKLGFSASRTMQLAQRLYEGVDIDGETVGLITYMRTDGVSMAQEAITSCRDVIGGEFGADYLPAQARSYSSKAKNAQEAHEAVRPTDMARLPKQVATTLDKDQARLYELIWKRAIASQMASARLERTTIEIASADNQVGFRATGSVLLFDGFLKLYQEGTDDGGGDEEEAGRLPRVAAKQALVLNAVRPDQHFTEPPPRFTEASLVKRMEELGIGRPSTYASILSVLRERTYVTMDKSRFVPEDKGRLVTAFLESFFTRYVEYDFTAALEEQLDEISAGKIAWKQVLSEFWRDFNLSVESISDLRVSQVLDKLNEVLGPHVFPETEPGVDPRRCPACEAGQLSLKVGRFGAFIGCSEYPECNYTRQMSTLGDAPEADTGPRLLGEDPETGLPVTLRKGRFGLFLQLGEPEEKGDKPKRAGIPKGVEPESVDLSLALQLLSLPREVGDHPETGKPITAAIGPYGPYVRHDGKYANLGEWNEVFNIGLNRAVAVLAEAKSKGGRRGQAALKELGEHPDDGAAIRVMDGRFGPYVKWNKINATLPKDKDPQEVTLEEAIALVNAKAAKGPRKKVAANKKPAKKQSTAKTAAAKKPAAKKSTAKKKSAKKGDADADAAEEPSS